MSIIWYKRKFNSIGRHRGKKGKKEKSIYWVPVVVGYISFGLIFEQLSNQWSNYPSFQMGIQVWERLPDFLGGTASEWLALESSASKASTGQSCYPRAGGPWMCVSCSPDAPAQDGDTINETQLTSKQRFSFLEYSEWTHFSLLVCFEALFAQEDRERWRVTPE